jgi:hypothetical protein
VFRKLVAFTFAALVVSSPLCADDSLRAEASPEAGSRTNVVIIDAQLASWINDGYYRSPTLRRLIDELESLNWKVFVQAGPCPVRTAVGCLLHTVGTFEGQSYLRIRASVSSRHPDVVISTVGHELRHALEVVTSGEVHDGPSLTALYDRIGDMHTKSAQGRVFETKAADHAGREVLRELRRVRSSAGGK